VPGTMEQIRKCKARHEKEVHEKEAANSNNGSKWFFWRRLFNRNKKELNIVRVLFTITVSINFIIKIKLI
jgi:hypothetical protein